MGVPFAERLRRRRENDDQMLRHSLEQMYASVTGDSSALRLGRIEIAHEAMDRVLSFYGAPKGQQLRESYDGVEDFIEDHLSASGIQYRRVKLRGKWWRSTVGCLLGFTKDGDAVALEPRRGVYTFVDPHTDQRVRVDGDIAEHLLGNDAFCFYKPLPNRKLEFRDIGVFLLITPRLHEYFMALVASLLVALVGAVVPYLNSLIYDNILPNFQGLDTTFLVTIGVVGATVAAVAVSRALFEANVALVTARFTSVMKISLQSAFMARVLRFPTSFFRGHSVGELNSRLNSVGQAVDGALQLAFGSMLSGVFLAVYVLQLLALSPGMFVPTLVVVLLTLGLNVVAACLSQRREARILEAQLQTSKMELSNLNGVAKIRAAGAESRAYAQWADPFSKQTMLAYGKPGPLVWAPIVTMAASSVGLVVLMACAWLGGVKETSDYMVFAGSYGLISGCIASLTGSVSQAFAIKPHFDMLKPLMSALPEAGSDDQILHSPCGRIELRQVTFGYEEADKPLFDDLSLSVDQGEYVGIVGKSGCGKSTLLRLMLGFERAQAGGVYFDGRNLARLNCERLRRDAYGVVLQDSALFGGSILDNISIATPSLSRDEAWEAIRIAGLEEVVRAMPMGMDTFVGANGCNLSGGQRQRVLIARAVAARPKVLLLDEATSALDNIVQAQVADALAHLGCTRIVVAHRLSTVVDCDRILMLEDGRIVEEGTYEELIQLDGKFADLVRRQRL